MQEEKELFFVGVRNPIELRRTMLESSKEIIEDLQKYERLKALRAEKAKQIEKLRTIVKEINRLVAKLKAELPTTSLRIEEMPQKLKKPEMVKPKKTAKEIKAEPKKELTELEKLESELDAIEQRLSGIK